MRIFSRFLQGIERITSMNSRDIFLGEYIHKSLIVFFNSILIEEFIINISDKKIGNLDLTTPISSDDIFTNNISNIILNTNKYPINISEYIIENFPLTFLVISCPLWPLYINLDNKNTINRINTFINIAFGTHSRTYYNPFDIHYSVNNAKFENLYYILNSVAIQRKTEIFIDNKISKELDPRSDLGKKYNMPTKEKHLNKKSFAQKIVKAINEQEDLQKKYRSQLDNIDDKNLKSLLAYFYDSIYAGWLKSQFLQNLKKYLLEELGNA